MRRLPIALLAVGALAALPPAAFAARFPGAFIPTRTYEVSYGAVLLLPRVFCPPRTQSTPRPGDFSFCRGTLTLSRRGRVLGVAPFSVRTYDSHAIQVPIEAWARPLFRPRNRVRVRWVARSHDGRGRAASRAGYIHFRNRFRR